MKALLGVVSLLVALAVLGMIVSRQLKATHLSAVAALPGGREVAASGTLRQQSQQMQQRVTDDIAKAMTQGAERNADAEKRDEGATTK